MFVSYAHEDRRWLERVLVHLKPLERDGLLDVWADSRLRPGQRWKQEIAAALRSARVAVLLVSADFLASDFIVEYELPELLAGAERRGTSIMPIVVAPSRFTKHPQLSEFQALNSPDVPLIKMRRHGQESMLVLLADAIEEALEDLPRSG